MRDDDEGNKPTQDSDRAAILVRRKQFIALALSGLTTTTACTDGSDNAGAPKTEQPVEKERNIKVNEPQPCLSVAPPTETDPQPKNDPEQVPPQVCLKIALPPEPPPEDQPKPEPKPQPCLKKAAPKPCLKVAPESG